MTKRSEGSTDRSPLAEYWGAEEPRQRVDTARQKRTAAARASLRLRSAAPRQAELKGYYANISERQFHGIRSKPAE